MRGVSRIPWHLSHCISWRASQLTKTSSVKKIWDLLKNASLYNLVFIIVGLLGTVSNWINKNTGNVIDSNVLSSSSFICTYLWQASPWMFRRIRWVVVCKMSNRRGGPQTFRRWKQGAIVCKVVIAEVDLQNVYIMDSGLQMCVLEHFLLLYYCIRFCFK